MFVCNLTEHEVKAEPIKKRLMFMSCPKMAAQPMRMSMLFGFCLFLTDSTEWSAIEKSEDKERCFVVVLLEMFTTTLKPSIIYCAIL